MSVWGGQWRRFSKSSMKRAPTLERRNKMTANATATQMAPVPTKAMEQQDVCDRFDQIYNSIAQRAFEIFESNGRSFGHEFDDWFKAESEILHPVHVRLAESDDTLTVEAEDPASKPRICRSTSNLGGSPLAARRKPKKSKRRGRLCTRSSARTKSYA